MKLKFWGAAQTVTGSMHLLELDNGKKILLDCGLYQGGEGFATEYNTTFPCEPPEIDVLILSHAHIDHCGNIPQLVREGFRGDIYSTHATFDLASLLLMDSARIQERTAEYDNRWRRRKGLDEVVPLYTEADVPAAMDLFQTISYNRTRQILPGVELLFLDAGHMLGSASVNLTIKEGDRTLRIGFTGDVGRPDSLILRNPVPMPPCDYLISESTYGGKDHEFIPDAENALLEVIRETCVENRGKLIIPAFSVGRTQNLVYTMDKLENQGKLPPIPVFLDSPLAVNATQVFEMHPECYDEDLRMYLKEDPNPFGWNRMHYIRDVEASKALNSRQGPCVIISASGMMTAGRILHHLANSIENPKNTILVVGYCANGTLGEKIVNGAKTVKIHGEEYHVNARIKKLNAYSGHAGQTELFNFISNQDKKTVQRIFLVHGEVDRAHMFADFLAGKGYDQVTIPSRGETFVI
ncbi:MAG: MBL fold metallo-hydrolase [Bacteroidia bacterium]|nr:MBL fold metallo-hydrolase [Bacteroidia bacterium]